MAFVKFANVVRLWRIVDLMRKIRDAKQFVSCPGSRVHEHFAPVFDGNRTILEKSGETDIQAEINSYAKYTDLHFMLHRLSVGDTSVLSNRPALYGDFSALPSNPVDVINLVRNAESSFGELSGEERATFDNDWRKWLSSLLSGSLAGNHPVSVSVQPSSIEDVNDKSTKDLNDK